jgi:hypothetical protein
MLTAGHGKTKLVDAELTEVGVTETPLTLIETVVNLPKSVPVKVIGVPE